MRNVRLRSVIKDNIKCLLFWIFIVVALLVCCMALDSADEDVVVTANHSQVNVTNCTVVDGVHYDNKIVKDKDVGVAKLHKVITTKPKYPTISMWAKPSCGCRNSYRWHYRTFVNYCPHCKHYGVLRKNPKGVYEKEYTCVIDDCDYCAVCGKEKYSWSHYYLRRA